MKLYKPFFKEEIEYVLPDEDGNVLNPVDEIHIDIDEDATEYDIDVIELEEAIRKARVIRNGKVRIKYKTDKPGYKLIYKDGRPREVKMKGTEVRNRKRVAKISARKLKSKRKKMILKRKKSINKRTWQ